ncbi:MAG: hypothetical protein EAZ06_05840 [Cytophagales bacterium]|nr:MAG: hypothetical protein EAY69_09375 [Cytophagales bacterium]TAH29668.1 MAG: hypothetical protein EAZ06_05840 [Cytophagales bacterium]
MHFFCQFANLSIKNQKIKPKNKKQVGDYVLSCKAQSQKREKKLGDLRFSLFLSLQVCFYHYRKQPKKKRYFDNFSGVFAEIFVENEDKDKKTL